jgi:leucyl-tRNA synthetase
METKAFDEKQLNLKIADLGEPKRARQFVHGLKKRLLAGEEIESVADKELVFDEMEVSLEMASLIKKNTGIQSVKVISVDEWKGGPDVHGNRQLSSVVDLSIPGHPSFHVENLRT